MRRFEEEAAAANKIRRASNINSLPKLSISSQQSKVFQKQSSIDNDNINDTTQLKVPVPFSRNQQQQQQQQIPSPQPELSQQQQLPLLQPKVEQSKPKFQRMSTKKFDLSKPSQQSQQHNKKEPQLEEESLL
jgi:hypothetical protein